MLAMSRWYQISLNPLRVLNRTAVEMFLATLCFLQAVYFPVMIFDDTPEKPALMIMNLLTVWNVTTFDTDEHIVQMEHMVGFLFYFFFFFKSAAWQSLGTPCGDLGPTPKLKTYKILGWA